jgi:hypothetical protein
MNTPNRTPAFARDGATSSATAHSASTGIPIFFSIIPPSTLLDDIRCPSVPAETLMRFHESKEAGPRVEAALWRPYVTGITKLYQRAQQLALSAMLWKAAAG